MALASVLERTLLQQLKKTPSGAGGFLLGDLPSVSSVSSLLDSEK